MLCWAKHLVRTEPLQIRNFIDGQFVEPVYTFYLRRFPADRIAVSVQSIFLRVPQILVRLIHLAFLLSRLFQCRNTFYLCISTRSGVARRLRGFATTEKAAQTIKPMS